MRIAVRCIPCCVHVTEACISPLPPSPPPPAGRLQCCGLGPPKCQPHLQRRGRLPGGGRWGGEGKGEGGSCELGRQLASLINRHQQAGAVLGEGGGSLPPRHGDRHPCLPSASIQARDPFSSLPSCASHVMCSPNPLPLLRLSRSCKATLQAHRGAVPPCLCAVRAGFDLGSVHSGGGRRGPGGEPPPGPHPVLHGGGGGEPAAVVGVPPRLGGHLLWEQDADSEGVILGPHAALNQYYLWQDCAAMPAANGRPTEKVVRAGWQGSSTGRGQRPNCVHSFSWDAAAKI